MYKKTVNSNNQVINNKILDKFFIKSEINEEFELTMGWNTWLEKFLPDFNHVDTIFKEDYCRLQGWYFPKGEDLKSIPMVEIGLIDPEFGLWINDLTIYKSHKS